MVVNAQDAAAGGDVVAAASTAAAVKQEPRADPAPASASALTGMNGGGLLNVCV
jgi:hypothetical protein